MSEPSDEKLPERLDPLAAENHRLRRRVAALEAERNQLRTRCVGLPPALDGGEDLPAPPAPDPPRAQGGPETSAERFRALLASVPNVAVQGYRGDGTVFYWNRASERIYGYSAEEAVGRNLIDLTIPDEMRELVRVDIRQMAESGVPSPPAELNLLRKTGETVPVFSSHAVVPASDGEAELYCLDLDLTEIHRLTRALRKSEERLRLALEAAEDGYWDWDIVSGRVYWSPRCYTMLGYEPDAFPVDFETWLALIHPDDREATHSQVKWELPRGGTFLAEFRYRTADGGWRWVMGRGRTVERDAEGRPTRMVGTHVDIQARKEAETALAESEARYRLLAENATDVIWTMNVEGRFTYMSPSVYRLRGFTAEEVMVRPMADALTPDSRKRAMAALEEALAQSNRGGAPPPVQRLELTQPHKDGGIVWTESVISPMVSPSGGLTGFLGVTRDIGERKRAEEALRKTSRQLEAILRHSPALITMMDAQGRYVLVNPAAARALGHSEAEVIGRFMAELVPPDLYKTFAERIDTVLRTGAPLLVEDRAPTSQGERDFETTLFPVETDDGTVVCGIARDVTDRKRAEKERRELERRLLQAQKMESLGVLAGGVAHDFNNILMTVLGHLELALEELPTSSPARTGLLEAFRASRRGADLTRQMLAYSGKGKFQSQPICLSAFIEENVAMIQAGLSRNRELELRLPRGLPRVLADPDQVRQILMNLVTNAAEAMGDNPGTVILETDVLDLTADALAAGRAEVIPPPGRFVRLSITDTGWGMDAETCRRVFEPFFTTKFIGRGLGMSAVQGIVQGHGGTLFVETTPGEGTTVRVLFPAVAASAASASAGEQRKKKTVGAPAKPGGTILLVDDDAAVRKLGEKMLQRVGHPCITAVDGEDAVAVFQGRKDDIHAIILDLTMPRMDGIRAAEALRELHPEVPILLSSGYSEAEVGPRLGGVGISGFIQKPYRLDRLRAALKTVLPDR